MSTPTTIQQSTAPHSALGRLVARHPVATFLIMAFTVSITIALILAEICCALITISKPTELFLYHYPK